MKSEIKDLVEYAVTALRNEQVTFALLGGVAVNAYRRESRITFDVDFAVLSEGFQEKAIEIIERIGLKAAPLSKAQLDGGPLHAIRAGSTPTHVVIGSFPDAKEGEVRGLDIMLPAVSWVPEAIKRAQNNLRTIHGISNVPVLVPEDLVLTKLVAYNSKKTRVKDLADLRELFSGNVELDIELLSSLMTLHKAPIPKVLHPLCHFELLRAHRKISKTRQR